jgi:hypothetical protein
VVGGIFGRELGFISVMGEDKEWQEYTLGRGLVVVTKKN